jgi:ubiquinol-cytochrome c reductase iron-sulfur subunit
VHSQQFQEKAGMAEGDTMDDPQRRDFLGTVTAGVAGAGVAAACWPFVASMNPSTDVLAKGTTHVDLNSVPLGELRTVAWQGKPVFILHRTPEEIAAMEASPGGKDPQPDDKRVQQPQWLVVVGICTHLGCVPNRNETGWLCPCHGSVYDNSARILHGPAPRNLEVPPYRFTAADKIIIGEKPDGPAHG